VSDDRLLALHAGREVGAVQKGRGNRLTFRYREEWRSSPGAFPLSLSMPLAAADHGHEVITAFLWGLLPDNELILERWGRRFGVSARNAFALLAQVGEDCAGAIQFVRPERVDAVLASGAADIDWLDEKAVADRLRALRVDPAAWRIARDVGHFSLGGAQPKTALHHMNGRWGVPSGRTPTTHILKPPTVGLDGHVENEHVCLALARALRIPAASSEVMSFHDEVAIVVERYDRQATQRTRAVVRVHQEDLCQALGLMPTSKYQNDGGPSPERVVDLLRTHSSNPREDVGTFVDALAFNWLIAGTDGHGKNYSVLHGPGGRLRLAPLYDLASVLPYDDFEPQRVRLAMKIGGKYRIRDIGRRQWERLAGDLRLDPEETVDRVVELARLVPERSSEVLQIARSKGLTHPILEKLGRALMARSEQCLSTLVKRAG